MSSRERPVVARLMSGLVIRGTTLDFNPERPSFRVSPEGAPRGVEVKIKDLKALFFVKPVQPAGLAVVEPGRTYAAAPNPAVDGKRIVVRFQDGEVMTGYTLSYRPEKLGFYLFPDDPESQHERIFVHSAAVAEVKTGAAAEAEPIAVRRKRPEAA